MSVAVFALEYLGHTIVHSLEVVNQGQNVSVADRNPLQHSDLISDLTGISVVLKHAFWD